MERNDCKNDSKESSEYREWHPELHIHTLHRVHGKKRVTREEVGSHFSSIAELVSPGSIVAVQSGDVDTDYYLLRCSTRPEALATDEDVGGILQPRGTLVVKRECLEFVKTQPPRTYKLLSLDATVCVNSVRYICPNSLLNVSGRSGKYLHVDEGLHEIG